MMHDDLPTGAFYVAFFVVQRASDCHAYGTIGLRSNSVLQSRRLASQLASGNSRLKPDISAHIRRGPVTYVQIFVA